MEGRRFSLGGIFLMLLFSMFVLAEETPFSVETTTFSEEAQAVEITIVEERAGTTPDSPLYVVDKIVENTQLALKSGEDKAAYALQVKGEKIAEAALMTKENKSKEAGTALEKAGELAGVIEKEISPALESLAKEETAFSNELLAAMKKDLPTWREVNALVEQQKTNEEKIQVAMEMSKKIGGYCEQMAMQDYDLMIKDDYCNPDNAPEWLRDKIKTEMTDREEEAKKEMVSQITTCINDPRQCDCSKIPVAKHRNDCEKNTALAIKCEYEQEMAACDELSKQPIVPEDIPSFLRPLFEQTVTELIAKKEKEMFAKFAPPECVEAGVSTREDCEKIMKEKYGEPPAECQKEGQFIGEKECNQIMIQKFNIPPECIKSDGVLMREEECMQVLVQSGKIPPECLNEGKPLPREECEKIMLEKNLPPPCKEKGALTREACEEVMKESFVSSGMGPPPECLKDGQFIGEGECTEIMKNKFAGQPGVSGQTMPGQPGRELGQMPGQPGQMPVGGVMPPAGQMPPLGQQGVMPPGQQSPESPPIGVPEAMPPAESGGAFGFGPPPEAYRGGNQHLVMGPQGSQLINQPELERLKQDAERRMAEGQAPPEEIERLRQEVGQLRQQMEQMRQELEQLRQQNGQGPMPQPGQSGQPLGPPQIGPQGLPIGPPNGPGQIPPGQPGQPLGPQAGQPEQEGQQMPPVIGPPPEQSAGSSPEQPLSVPAPPPESSPAPSPSESSPVPSPEPASG